MSRAIDPQGVALGCCSVPFQGRENTQRIGLSEVPARGDRQSTLRTARREARTPEDPAESVTHPFLFRCGLRSGLSKAKLSRARWVNHRPDPLG